MPWRNLRMNKKISAMAACMLFALQGAVAADKPLLMEGKSAESSLYQRVLTTPACVLKKSASDKKGTKVNAFTRYYVYKKDGSSLAVGPDTTGKISGYIDESCAIEWKQQTALMFTNPAGRNRSLIFNSKDALQDIVDSKNPKEAVMPLMDKAINSGKADNVVAVEPENYIDYKKQFYLLPVIEAEESMFDDGNYTRELKVASINDKSTAKKESADDSQSELKSFKAAMVFVVDSSISMQPYIDRTKQAIKTIYKRLEKEHLQNSVQFGLVSFRSSTKAVPGLEYTSKMFVNPGSANSVEEFSEKLKTLDQAKVSSALFDEDAYSGIYTALNEVDWNSFGGRYVVLITDAGAIEGSNKLSSTLLDARELRLEASHKGAAIYALHLLTDSGKRHGNHDKAKAQYEDLTFNEILQKPLYYPVDAGDVNSFGTMMDTLADNLTEQVKNAAMGKDSAGAAGSARKDEDSKNISTEDMDLLGHAMKLAFLGSRQQTTAPDFFSGWLSDRDLIDHQKPTATPVVLLTKLQLSDLKEITTRILDSANAGILNPDDMFAQLRSVAVSLGRDPSALGDSKTLKLSEMGLLGEYLEGLPYKSRIQELDEDTWSSMGPDEQNQTIEDLESMLAYYQQCNDDNDRWVSLAEDADASENVYPVPLEALP